MSRAKGNTFLNPSVREEIEASTYLYTYLCLCLRNLMLNPVCQTTHSDDLLQVLRELPNLLLLTSPILTLLQFNDAPYNIPCQRPPCPSGWHFVRGSKRSAESVNKMRQFQAQKRIVDAVPGEDASETTHDNMGDLLGRNCGGSLRP